MIHQQWPKIFNTFCLCLGLSFITSAWATSSTLPPPLPEKAAPDITMIKKSGVLRVAFFDRDMPPFFMHDANNNWTGIEIDLAQLIADQLKVKLVIVPVDEYNDIIDVVANGKADMGMGLLSITPERELKVTFTDPYYTFQHHLLVNRIQAAQNNWSIWQVGTIMQTTDKPITIAALANSAQGQILRNLYPHATIIEYPTLTAAMQAVVAGKVFAALGNSPVEVRNFLQNNPKAALAAEDVIIPINSIDLTAVAVPWQYFYFKDWLDLYFDYLEQNGIETEIFEKYNQPIEAKDEFAYPT